MKKQTITLLAALAAILTLSATLVACHDDLEGDAQKYDDGYLHFNFLFDNQGQWKDGATAGRQTRMMAPVEMTMPEGFDTPLYLHCIEENYIETAPTTRGERITDEAFDDRNKIQCFGLYAVVNGEKVLATSTSALTADYTEIKRNTLNESGDWQVKEAELKFSGDGGWPNGKTGDFYGFAPFPGWDADEDAGNGHARCIVIDTDASTPTITFNMQPEEEHNKDILTAKKTGVTKDEKNAGVELKFQHILSALKFKLDDDTSDGNGTNDLKYTVGVGGNEYFLQVKSITVADIYDQGTVAIGDTYTDDTSNPSNPVRTSKWVVDNTSTDSCTATLNRSYGAITGDTKKLINTDEHCMMVLPQTAPTGAKLIITADLTTDEAGTAVYKSDVTFEASLAGLTWKPGYSYTYKISKDTKAKSYTLTSDNGRSDNAFMFEVNGDVTSSYPVDFDVTSYATLSDDGVTTTQAAVSWHIEYSEDGGSTWKAGLPLGWNVKNKSTGEAVTNNHDIPGSLSDVTYTIDAPVRLDGSPAVASLTSHDYSKHVGDDGYYDLSLHGLGWNAVSQSTVRNTANCYIINGYGKFEIPLVYGNGVKMGQENPKAYQYAWAQNTTYDASGLTYPHGHSVFCDHNGNQINHAWMSAQLGHSLSSAEIVWQDHNIVSNVTLDDTKNDYLRFEIRKEDVQPGNIVLAVKDGDDIAWSWHIWVTVNTDFATTTRLSHTINSNTYNMDVAKYSLGWTNPIVKNNEGTKPFTIRVVQNDKMGKHVDHDVEQKGGIVSSENSALIYQNGRKDPFPNFGLKIVSASSDASGNITATYDEENLFVKLGITDHTLSSSELTPSYCHRNPKSFVFSTSNWFKESGLATSYASHQVYECWNPEGDPQRGAATGREGNYQTHTKTIYDPSPVGFMVPNSGLANMLANDTPFTSGTTIEIDEEHHTASAPYPYVKTNSGLIFYTTGGRRINTNTTPWSYYMDRGTGYFWTAGLWSNGQYGVYYYTSSSAVTFNATGSGGTARTSSSGFSIRPIKDDQQDVVAAWSSLPVMTFHEGDSKNNIDPSLKAVELTQNGTTNNWGISDLNSVTIRMQDGAEVTLGSIINDKANKKNQKLLVRQIKVYFDYSGYTYGYFDVGGYLLGHRTLNSYSISHTLGTKTETHGQSAYVLTVDIPDHWLFSSGWVTKYSQSNNGDPDTWDFANLVPLNLQRVNVTKVEAELRINYYTN